MKLGMQIASTCVVLALSSSAAFSQSAVELKDGNAKYTMQLGGDIAWNTDIDLTGPQSTLVASSPEGHEPLTLVSAMTYLEKNPMVMLGNELQKKTTEGFLEGLCENYQCADISARSYEDIGGRMAWVVTTKLDLPAYIDMGVPEAVLIAASTPDGYMQLFSLHTADGKADELKPILIEAFKSVTPFE
ncbi:hypothetical protein [Celeribacter sp.]|uniref:hypothetical protein n=1 Tax=Celeribacter sp. TaxID=1890673 RepID=UPI003A8C97D5